MTSENRVSQNLFVPLHIDVHDDSPFALVPPKSIPVDDELTSRDPSQWDGAGARFGVSDDGWIYGDSWGERVTAVPAVAFYTPKLRPQLQYHKKIGQLLPDLWKNIINTLTWNIFTLIMSSLIDDYCL